MSEHHYKKAVLKLGQCLAFVLLFTFSPLIALAAPVITNVSPASGPASGGTSVTITGTGFVTGDGSLYQTVNINNPNVGTTLSEYQVRISVDTQTLITAGKMRSDCGDIRFLASDNSTNLSYYLETGCNTTTTIIWVKVNTIPAGDSSIYMSYNVASRTSASSGDSTFIFFDNFEGTLGDPINTTKWPTQIQTLTGNSWIKTNTVSPAYEGTGTLAGSPNTMGVDGAYREVISQDIAIPSDSNAVVDYVWAVSSEGSYDFIYYCNTSSSGSGTNPTCRTSGYSQISGSQAWARVNDTSHVLSASNIARIKFGYSKDGSVSAGQDRGWVDAVKVRKYIGNDPTITGFGAEQANGSTVKFANTLATTTVNSSTQITATTPSFGSTGQVDVTVINPDASSGSSVYTYTASLPGAPTSLAATAGASQVGLTWAAPSSNGGATITDYAIQYRTSPSGGWTTFSDGVSTATSTTVTGLTNDTAYDFQVAAINSEGTGSYSSPVTSTPTVYYPPITFYYGGCCGIGITGVQLTGDGGYNINNTGTATPSTGPTYTDYTGTLAAAHLTPGSTYIVTITNGYSYYEYFGAWIDWNSDGDFTDTNETLGVLSSPSYVATGGQASFTFTVPADATSGLHRLRIGSEYYGYALNPSGSGPNYYGEYEDYSLQTASIPLSAPLNLTDQDFSVPGQVSLAWDAPTNNGGYAITSYNIEYGPITSCDPSTFQASGCSSFTAGTGFPLGTTISDLNTSTQYRFAVYAINAAASISPASNVITAPPMSITAINPSSAPNTGATNIVIAGNFFYAGPNPGATAVAIVKGNTTIPCSTLTFGDANTLTCNADLSSAAPGLYDIVATNADGTTSTLTQGLTVTVGPVTISSLSPNKGNIAGGTTVTVTGSNFVPQYYQVPYTIGAVGTATTDYQVPLTLDTATLIAQNKMNSDCSDIRVKNSDQVSPLSFWLQGPCDNASTVIWVKVPNISNTDNTTVYVTYGQPDLTSSLSNAGNTFLDILNVGLQANYAMDDSYYSNTLQDSSGNGFDATYSQFNLGSGKHGYSKYFDSSYYGVVPNNPSALRITGALTLETWVNLSAQYYYNYPRLISKLTGYPYDGFELLLGAPSAGYDLAYRPFMQLSKNGSLYYVSANTQLFPDSQWHHIVATYDPNANLPGDKAKIYVDGNLSVLTDQITASGLIGDNTVNVNLGRFAADGSSPLYGYMDDTRIYNQALTAGQVSEIYQNISFSDPSIPNSLIIRKDAGYDPVVTPGTESGIGAQISFDGIPAVTNLINSTTLTAVTPAHAEGAVDVHIVNGNADTYTLSNGFQYLDNRLVLSDINGGLPPTINEPFNITVESVDSSGQPYDVESDTTYSISVQTGNGYLSGPVSGTILTGNHSDTLAYTYNTVENGVVFRTQDQEEISPVNPLHLILNSTNSTPVNVITPPAADSANSSLSSDKATAIADGIDHAKVTAHLFSASNIPSHDKVTTLNIIGPPGNTPVITPVECITDNGETPGISNIDGDACFNVTSLYPGTFTFQATSETDSVIIAQTTDITFTGPTAANSTLTADKSHGLANGSSKITVIATVKDSTGNLFANRPITLQRTDSNAGQTRVTAISCPLTYFGENGTTNSSGEACFEITSTTEGVFSFNAQNTLDNQTFPTTPIQVTFGSGLIWGNSAAPIANGINDDSLYHPVEYQQIIPTSDGNYITTWVDARHMGPVKGGPVTTLMAQKFNSDGVPQWTSGPNFEHNGLVIFDAYSNTEARTVGNDILEPHIVADNQGGAIVMWYMKANGLNTDSTILGQHLTGSGTFTWGSPYEEVVADMNEYTNGVQQQMDMISDGNGGVFLTYRQFQGTTNWNGDYYAHDRFVDRINIDGSRPTVDNDPDNDGYESDWPISINSRPDCVNASGKLLLVNTPNVHQGVVRIAYEQHTNGGSCFTENTSQPLKIMTLNYSAAEADEISLDNCDLVNGCRATTEMMDGYSGSNPYPKNGTGFTTGCANETGAYSQTQPQLTDDGNGGMFLTFAESCDANMAGNNDAQIAIEHFPNASTGLLPGSRIIGQCVDNTCAFPSTSSLDLFADGNKDGKVFVGWHDKYDGDDIQQYTTSTLNGFSVPTPVWDSNTGSAYLDPLNVNFEQLVADHNSGVYVVGKTPGGNPSNMEPRATAYHIYADGSPVLNNTTTNGWAPVGNQIGSIPPKSTPATWHLDENNLHQTNERFIGGTLNNVPQTENHATVDANGDLLTAFIRESTPYYQNTSVDAYIQKLIGSSGLPAFQTANLPTEVQLDHDLDTTSLLEESQDQMVGLKTGAGSFVFAWRDDLDENGPGEPSVTTIRAEKFDEDGNTQWNQNNPPGRSYGRLIGQPNANRPLSNPMLVNEFDPNTGNISGNVIIAYQDAKNIYLSKLDKNSGAPIDGTDFVSQISADNNSDITLLGLTAVNDSAGGAVITYTDIYGGLYITYDNRWGLQWTRNINPPNGMEIPGINGFAKPVQLSNGRVAVIFKQVDSNTGDSEIYGDERYLSNGESSFGLPILITDNSNILNSGSLLQQNPDITLDDTGSNIYVAYEYVNINPASNAGEYCIGVQKVNSNLQNVWSDLQPCQSRIRQVSGNLSTPYYHNPKLSLDDNGNLDVSVELEEFTITTNFPNPNAGVIWDIKLDQNTGNQIWNEHQVSNTDANYWNRGAQIASDGNVGHFIAFRGYYLPTGTSNILLQHVVSAINQIHNSLTPSINYGIQLASGLTGTDLNLGNDPILQIVGDNAYSSLVSWIQDVDDVPDVYGQYFVDNRLIDSNISSSPVAVPADGTSSILVTSSITDANRNPIVNQTLNLYAQVYQSFSSTTSRQPTIADAPCPNSNSGTTGRTDENGDQCWSVTSTSPGLFRVTSYTDATSPRTVFTKSTDLTFDILPPNADHSTFTANPSSVNNNGSDYSVLTVTAKDAIDNALSNIPISISDDSVGQDVSISNVPCYTGGPTGLTDQNGQMCFQVSSTTEQTVNFTANVATELNPIQITARPSVTFQPPPADSTLSSIYMDSTSIEPVNGDLFDIGNLTRYNASNGDLIKVYTLDSNSNSLVGKPVRLNFAPNDGTTMVTPVSCSDPRDTTLIPTNLPPNTNLSDTFGSACFIVYNNSPSSDSLTFFNESQYTISVTVDAGTSRETTLLQTATLRLKPVAMANIFHYRFRNDDGNELTATSIAGVDTPNYSASNSTPFRLRMGISRRVANSDNKMMNDEFSPLSDTNIGDQQLGRGINGRAYSATTINENTHTLYTATVSAGDTDKVTIYGYDTFDMTQAPSQFTFPDTVDYNTPYNTNPNAPISGNIYDITNMFVDQTNNLLYMVVSPNKSFSDTDLLRVYKINLDNNQVVSVFSEDPDQAPFSTDFTQPSYDSEIDLDHGFLYLTTGGESNGKTTDTGIIKIKLNGPAEAMTKVGKLVIGNNSDLITSSVIDVTNQYMYVSTGKVFPGNLNIGDTNNPLPTKIVKIDLNVDATLPPIKVADINLVPDPATSNYETVGLQASVLDPIEGYAYFAGSTDESQSAIKLIGGNLAYITKVDINPNRQFEVVSRTKISSNTTLNGPLANDSDHLMDYVYFPTSRGITVDTSQHITPTASIDTVNHFAYFPGAQYNASRERPVWKMFRFDTNTGAVLNTNNIASDEMNYPSAIFINPDVTTYSATNGIFGNVFSPSIKKNFFIRTTGLAEYVTSFNTTTKWNFRLQSAKNTSGTNPGSYTGEFCDEANSDLQWSDLPNSDFAMGNSNNFTDGTASSNVTGLLPDNNETFVPGEMKSADSITSTLKLGRKEFTELEYSVTPTESAKGTYCFRLIEADPNHDNQVSNYPSLLLGVYDGSYPFTFTGHNYNIPVTIGGVIISKSSVYVMEGTTTDSYEIKLSSQPTDDVTVHVVADDSRLTLDPLSNPEQTHETDLTFNSNNWDTFQRITLSAANDNGTSNGLPTGIEGTTNGLIHHTSVSTDPAYNKLAIQPVVTAVTDYGATTSNVIAHVGSQALFTPPDSFNFPDVISGSPNPLFSPDLPITIEDTRGTHADYTLTLQASPFCKADGRACIPLNKVYLAMSDLNNTFNTFDAGQIGQFVANYLGSGGAATDRASFVHALPTDDRPLSIPTTIIDTRDIPSGSKDNPLQGNMTAILHLMIDYGSIPALQIGTYTTLLVFDFDTNPLGGSPI